MSVIPRKQQQNTEFTKFLQSGPRKFTKSDFSGDWPRSGGFLSYALDCCRLTIVMQPPPRVPRAIENKAIHKGRLSNMLVETEAATGPERRNH